METVCGYSCSGCDYHRKEYPRCGATKGEPFWTAYARAECCPIYDCCVKERQLPHCGKCLELIGKRFTRFKNPEVSDEMQVGILIAMEQELMARK